MKACVPVTKMNTTSRPVFLHRALLFFVALIVVISGCTPIDSGITVTTQPTTGSVQTVSPEPSTGPSSTQQTSMPTMNTSETGIEDKLASAPAIEGTEKAVMTIGSIQRVIYLALPDNPYGVAAGETIGEYKHEVFLGEEQTGGVALAAPAAKVCLDAALAAMPLQ